MHGAAVVCYMVLSYGAPVTWCCYMLYGAAVIWGWGCQYGDGVFCLAGISFELPISPEVSIHFRFG